MATDNMENFARDILNAGLGLFHTVTEKVDEIQKQILTDYNGLITKGASEKGDIAQKLRGGLDQGLTTVKEVQSRVLPK